MHRSLKRDEEKKEEEVESEQMKSRRKVNLIGLCYIGQEFSNFLAMEPTF